MARRSILGKAAAVRLSTWGWGPELIHKAKEMAQDAGYGRIAVISAIGTRDYYAKYHNFQMDGLYMTANLIENGEL